jgi:hypothetical protein
LLKKRKEESCDFLYLFIYIENIEGSVLVSFAYIEIQVSIAALLAVNEDRI